MSGESARWADLTIRLVVKTNSMGARISDIYTLDEKDLCLF